jgi:MFS family permease
MLGTRLHPLVAVIRSSELRRVQIGFLLSTIAEWASWLALVVYAYGRGGAGEAGVVGFVLSAPGILVVPALSVLGDRLPRARVLLGSDIVIALAFGAAAALLAWDQVIGAYLAAIVATLFVGLIRPLLGALLPEVATGPDELTAANVVTGIVEGAGSLLGPLIAGVVLVVSGAPGVLVACAVGLAIAAVAMWPVAARPTDPRGAEAEVATSLTVREQFRDLAAGAVAIGRDARLLGAVVLIAAIFGLLGAVEVFIVLIALDLLGLDEGAAGFLTAVSGIGAVVGSAASIVLVGRDRLGLALVTATAVFGLSVAVLGLATQPLSVALVLVVTGLGWSFGYVAATTLTQRLAGDDVMTRVFGLSEAVQTFAEALGALVVPVLVIAFGANGAIVIAGLSLGILALATLPIYLRSERADPELLRDVRLLRAVPMFEPLSAPVIERLAAGAVRLTVAAGTPIVREGEPGDRFYILTEGSAEVTINGRGARMLVPGDVFGEIALLRDVPRTATVLAVTPTGLLALDRGPFLEALTGQARSRRLAGDVAADRLAADAAAEST